jgi:hypothetical protein
MAFINRGSDIGKYLGKNQDIENLSINRYDFVEGNHCGGQHIERQIR